MENTQAIKQGLMPDGSAFDPIRVENAIDHVLYNQTIGDHFFAVKQFLYQVKDARRRISVIEEQIMYRQEAMEHLGPSYSETPRGAGGFKSKIETGIADIDALEGKLREAESELARVTVVVSDAICELEDVNQQMVLMKRYISGKSWECIAQEMDNTARWAQKQHGRALPHLEAILFGDACKNQGENA